ncbi:MAG: T9SS type A sorting domain-containing protein, partial [Bacteroidota bacterium]
DRVELSKADYVPFISIPTSLTLDCESTGPTIPLSLGDHQSVSWTGPNNFSSSDISPQINQAGIYTVRVQNAEECEATGTVNVQNGSYDPVTSIPAIVEIDCETNSAFIPLSIGVYESLLWTGPGNFQSTEESLTVTEAGVYTLTVSSQMGCIQVYEVIVDACETACIVSTIRQIILVNANNGQDVMEIQDGTNIDLNQFAHAIAIRAEEDACSFPVKSVRMVMTGTQNQIRTESLAPWALFGDNSGNFASWNASPGNYNLIATPYSEAGAKGVPGLSKEVNFSITQSPQGNRSFSSLNEVEEILINKAFLAPNRTSRHTHLHVEGEQNGPVEVTIFNTLGSRVVELVVEKTSTKQVFPLVLPQISEGMYWVQINYDQQQFSARLLIEN